MMLTDHVTDKLTKYFPESSNREFLLAVSGGIDSMVLLAIFNELSQANSYPRLYVTHYNHRMHSLSDESEKLVRDWTNHFDIPFIGGAIRSSEIYSNHPGGLEAGARELRYEFFNAISQTVSVNALITAHHFNDQVETVLLNIGRGSGLHGLEGMTPTKSTVEPLLFRPLLDVRKKTLKNYAKENSIPYISDPTNKDQQYARNQIRQSMIPSWEEVQPSPSRNIYKISRQAQRENKFWRDYLRKKFRYWNWDNEVQVDLSVFDSEQKAAQYRFLHIVPYHLRGNTYGWNQQNFDDLFELFTQLQSGKQIDLPHSCKALREYDRGVITSHSDVIDYEITPENPPFQWNQSDIGKIKITFLEKSNNRSKPNKFSSTIDRIDFKKVIIRTWNPGQDFLKNQSKTPKKLFSQNRIPFRARRNWPILVQDDRIICIPGIYSMNSGSSEEQFRIVFSPEGPFFHQILTSE